MRAPLSWLREFAPIEGDAGALADTLSDLGLVVEGLERIGEGLEQVVVARVLATRPHPNADKIQLVDVDPGDGSSTQVVCGAFNFGEGDLVPLAPVGARLPGDMEIGRRKVRGEWSEGMLCSGAELRLSDDHSGILVLGTGAPPGTPLAQALGITQDVVFDLDVTPNRPDALSMAGVARDLAARLGVPFAIPDPPEATVMGRTRATVEVDSLDLCPRFTATLVDHVTIDPSPAWMARRLTLAGMRPINNVVDVSNFVMLELGQPNHPYDLDRLLGAGLRVRRGREGEVLVTLDDVERAVSPDDCLICDADDTPVGVGGVMGGASTEITDDTTSVLLEAAWFAPMAIARTSKRLALRTEASVRFERGVDPEGVERAVARYCQLLSMLARAATVRPVIDVRGELPAAPRVRVRTDRVNLIMGTALAAEEVRAKLEPIGFACSPSEDGFDVAIPSWRPDCEREIDVIEEVGRHHGYAKVPRSMPGIVRRGRLGREPRDRRQVRQVLVGAGVTEAWTNSFLAPEDLARAGLPPEAVAVTNPLTAEESIMRPSLLPGLLRAVQGNAAHRNPLVSLFEMGRVFHPPRDGSPLPDEREHLALALAGRDAAAATRVWRLVERAMALQRVELTPGDRPGLHPSRTARLHSDGSDIGAVGEVDLDVLAAHGVEGRVGWLEVDLGWLLAQPRPLHTARPVSRYPSSDVDLAFVVDEAVPAAAVEQVLRRAVGDKLEQLVLFDVFRGPQLGEGRRSLAWRLRFSALDHTLTDDELARLRQGCIDAVEGQLPATLRA